MTRRDAGSGLAWPDHDMGPTPPPESSERPRDDEKGTRRPMAWWDRIKLILLLVGAWLVLVWSTMERTPIEPFRDAVRDQLRSSWFLLGLASLEALRQVHYLISEHVAWWHSLWSQRVFGGADRRVGRMNDWTRYRMGRVLRLLLVLSVLSFVLGRIYHVSPAVALFKLPAAVYKAMPLVLQLGFAFFFVIIQFVGLFWFLSRGGTDVYMPGDVKTRFSDVWGQDAVLERVKENIIFLRQPEAIEAKGGYVPGGILLWGPPGTGKTLMAEAVAGETNNPFVFVDPGAFTNMFMGVGILKVKSLFRKLRKLALRYGGVIVFFDEADSLGSRGAVAGAPPVAGTTMFDPHGCNGMNYASSGTRSRLITSDLASATTLEPNPPRGFIMGAGMGGGGGGTLQALLSELSGLKKPRGFLNRHGRRALGMKPKPPPKYRILVIMATNQPDVLDSALLRPGRIDRIYEVGYPSTHGRERTYQGYLDKIPHELTADNVHKLAVISTRGTGASIKDIVNEALVIALRDGRDVVTFQDMIKAKHLKEHGPASDWRYSDWEGHAVAVHEACHAVAMYRLKKREAIDVATIERRGGTGGFVAPVPLEDQFVHWKTEQEAEVMTFVASLAGERLLFEGNNSQGVGGDLRSATFLTMEMVGFHGMGDTVSSHGASLGFLGRRPGVIVEDGTDRQFLETEFGQRVEAKMRELVGRVTTVLEQDRRHVLSLAHALETHKTISGDDVVAVIEGGAGPLVDGRPYHDPDVMDTLELYHASVLNAMREHSRVEQPLPVLHGQP